MALKRGFIILWSGAIADIPYGWQLCDGTNGTPDLRNLFIVGAGDSFNPGDTDPGPTHTHDFTSDSHFHTIPAGAGLAAGADRSSTTSGRTVTGTTNPTIPLPPYHALAYIMKMASN